MTWTPTPKDALLAPDALLALLDPEPGEDAGVGGYITPSNLKTIQQHLASYTYWLQQETIEALTAEAEAIALIRKKLTQPTDDIGDLITVTGGSITDELHDIDARLAVLETPVEVPTPEGAITIDLYGGSFVRARADFGVLDGQPHWATVSLATVPGPNGAVFPDLDALRATNAGATWWDDGGSLGKVNSAAGADVPATAVATMIERGRIVQVVHSTGTDGHPLLTVLDSVAPPVDTYSLVMAVQDLAGRVAALEAAGPPPVDPTATCEVTINGYVSNQTQYVTLELYACGLANGFDARGDIPYPPLRFVWANGASSADVVGNTNRNAVRGRLLVNDGSEGDVYVFKSEADATAANQNYVSLIELVAWIEGGKHVEMFWKLSGADRIYVISVSEP